MRIKTLFPFVAAGNLLSAGALFADPVFLLAQANVTDSEVFFAEYGPAAFATLQEHGAQVYFGAQDYTAIEGEWTGNWTALVSFESAEKALEWYNSDDYHELARPLRLSSTDGGKLIMFQPAAAE